MSYSASRKRKHAPKYRPQPSQESDPALVIQAHEADIVSGPHALQFARSLEIEVLTSGAKRIGDALIRWNASRNENVNDEGDVKPDEGQGVWVDRYDARLLLDALPATTVAAGSSKQRSLSPTGWSDLPSDNEDTFFLSPDETEDYRRDKRRKFLETLREQRMRALRAEAGEDDGVPIEETWGGSDEEPEEQQTELMRRTAIHVLTSPNPARLEMRILANHGADPRFAFLKGRWSRRWKILKARVKADKEVEETKTSAGALGGLSGYGDSDEDDEDNTGAKESGGEQLNLVVPSTPANGGGGDSGIDDTVKAARRARAKEWAEKRRAGRAN